MEKPIKDISICLSQFNEQELQNLFFQTCLHLNFPIAFWKLPDSDEKKIILEFTNKIDSYKLNLDSEKSGFALSPFLNAKNENTLMIRPDLIYDLKNKRLTINEAFEKEKVISAFFEELINKNKPGISTLLEKLPDLNHLNNDKKHYTRIVEKAINLIKGNELKKVVLARSKEIKLNGKINPVIIFNDLCIEQKSSFVSLVFIPDQGLWIGASPELLVSINKNNIFKTTALAGTQKIKDDDELCNAVWTQKEIEEQALVNRYIISCFKTIRLREYEEDGPRTVRAGSLVHLKTDFSVNMKEVNFPELGTVMLDLLHPTSAICGMPKENAMSFIHNNENLNRKFYSGFLGPVNLEGESHIFVNIRCAKIGNQKAVLYSGAGITAESNPEKEFEETELKMKTMERILGFE